MQVDARSLARHPLCRYRVVDVCLVYYPGYHLSFVMSVMIFVVRHDVYGWDGIDDAILEKERDKCAEGIYNKANNDKINGYEDLRASPHRKIW